MTAASAEPRRRSSADSRQRLLTAAGELFAERGYEGTTVREIGQHAGADPTLIARYFGSKAALYLAALRPNASTDPLDLDDAAVLQRLLDRVGSGGPTPTLYAAVRPHADAELQDAAMAVIRRRMLDPTEADLGGTSLGQSRLRAEIVVAALAGIVLSRTSGAFEVLAQAPSDEVAALVAELLGGLLTDRP